MNVTFLMGNEVSNIFSFNNFFEKQTTFLEKMEGGEFSFLGGGWGTKDTRLLFRERRLLWQKINITFFIAI